MRKREILSDLKKTRDRIGEIIEALDKLSDDNPAVQRNAQATIVFTFFELMDSIGQVEIGVYNYLKRRGKK